MGHGNDIVQGGINRDLTVAVFEFIRITVLAELQGDQSITGLNDTGMTDPLAKIE